MKADPSARLEFVDLQSQVNGETTTLAPAGPLDRGLSPLILKAHALGQLQARLRDKNGEIKPSCDERNSSPLPSLACPCSIERSAAGGLGDIEPAEDKAPELGREKEHGRGGMSPMLRLRDQY